MKNLIIWIVFLLGSLITDSAQEFMRVNCAAKFRIEKDHSACKAPSPLLRRSGVTKTELKLILDTHNGYRRQVEPLAANMLKMTWDVELAMLAESWANTCSFTHDKVYNRNIPGRFTLGQNIGQGYNNWTMVMKAWFDEKSIFQYGSDKNDLHKIGHYTQIVWATTNKIGCGYADCNGTAFHVCDYGPGGNTPLGSLGKPYIKTNASCSSCATNCENKLCNCDFKTCENGGVLNLTTCDCDCNMESYVGVECKLDCGVIKQKWYCGKEAFTKAGCRIFANVPYDCPLICGYCPSAGINYKEQQVFTDLEQTTNIHNIIGQTGGVPTYTPNLFFLLLMYLCCFSFLWLTFSYST